MSISMAGTQIFLQTFLWHCYYISLYYKNRAYVFDIQPLRNMCKYRTSSCISRNASPSPSLVFITSAVCSQYPWALIWMKTSCFLKCVTPTNAKIPSTQMQNTEYEYYSILSFFVAQLLEIQKVAFIIVYAGIHS